MSTTLRSITLDTTLDVEYTQPDPLQLRCDCCNESTTTLATVALSINGVAIPAFVACTICALAIEDNT